MRAGELRGLGSAISILTNPWFTCVRVLGEGRINLPRVQSALRSFALSPALLAHLAGYCRAWKPNERGVLLATRTGTPWDANLLVKRKLYPLGDSLGIERGGLHAFRHTNSTFMDRLGVPLKVRQQRLGHSDSSLTPDVYTHVASEGDVRLAAQLDAILRPNAPKNENGSGVEPPKPFVV